MEANITTAELAERERAAAVRLTRFRGDMNDEDFGRLVKEVVRILCKSYRHAFDERLRSLFPPSAEPRV